MTGGLEKNRHIHHPIYKKFRLELRERFFSHFPTLLKGQLVFLLCLGAVERILLPSVYGFVSLAVTALFVALEFGVSSSSRSCEKNPLELLYGGATFGIASLAGSCVYISFVNVPPEPLLQILILFLYVLFMGLVLLYSFHLRPLLSSLPGLPLLPVVVFLGLRYGFASIPVFALLFPFLFLALFASSAAILESFFYRDFRKKTILEDRRKLTVKRLDRAERLNLELLENRSSLEKEIEKRKLVEKNLEQIAAFDDLTAVYNRRAGVELLKEGIHYSLRTQSPMTIAFVDLDGLKLVNDNFGHSMGDTFLREVVFFLRKHLRKSDSLSRLGGDEFLVILTDCNEAAAQAIFDRVEEDVRLVNRGKRLYPISISYGLAEAKVEDEKNYRSLLALADERMYLNKQEKRLKPPRNGEVSDNG